jgi:hypothetical protein
MNQRPGVRFCRRRTPVRERSALTSVPDSLQVPERHRGAGDRATDHAAKQSPRRRGRSRRGAATLGPVRAGSRRNPAFVVLRASRRRPRGPCLARISGLSDQERCPTDPYRRQPTARKARAEAVAILTKLLSNRSLNSPNRPCLRAIVGWDIRNHNPRVGGSSPSSGMPACRHCRGFVAGTCRLAINFGSIRVHIS